MVEEYRRNIRVAEQIKREVGLLIDTIARNERLGLISVTQVDVSPDLTNAKVYISTLAANPLKVVKSLNQHRGELRHYLAQKLTTRVVPKITVVHDASLEKSAQLANIFITLQKEKRDEAREKTN